MEKIYWLSIGSHEMKVPRLVLSNRNHVDHVDMYMLTESESETFQTAFREIGIMLVMIVLSNF